MIGRFFGRQRDNKQRRVKTLEDPDIKKDVDETTEDKPPPSYRVIMYGSEGDPSIVAKRVAKVVPSIDRRFAFELCLQARYVGKVPLLLCDSKKQAEMYCVGLQRQGVRSTIEEIQTTTNIKKKKKK